MYIAIDIGGTKTLAAVFNEKGEIVEEVKFPTPKDYLEFVKTLKLQTQKFSSKDFMSGAIGTRGIIDRVAGQLIRDSILEWRDAPLVRDLTGLFDCSFVIENDSKAAGLSEAALLAKDFRKVLYITISTGIGSSFVVDGKIEPNVIDSEIGLWLYRHEGKIQTWESFASGRAIVEKYGKRAADIDDPSTWSEISENIAIGIINASAAYTPNIIVLGGGVGEHYERYAAPLSGSITRLTPEGVNVPQIRQAIQPSQAVIYGCYELARKKEF